MFMRRAMFPFGHDMFLFENDVFRFEYEIQPFENNIFLYEHDTFPFGNESFPFEQHMFLSGSVMVRFKIKESCGINDLDRRIGSPCVWASPIPLFGSHWFRAKRFRFRCWNGLCPNERAEPPWPTNG